YAPSQPNIISNLRPRIIPAESINAERNILPFSQQRALFILGKLAEENCRRNQSCLDDIRDCSQAIVRKQLIFALGHSQKPLRAIDYFCRARAASSGQHNDRALFIKNLAGWNADFPASPLGRQFRESGSYSKGCREPDCLAVEVSQPDGAVNLCPELMELLNGVRLRLLFPVLEHNRHQETLQLVEPSNVESATVENFENGVDQSLVLNLMKDDREPIFHRRIEVDERSSCFFRPLLHEFFALTNGGGDVSIVSVRGNTWLTG